MSPLAVPPALPDLAACRHIVVLTGANANARLPPARWVGEAPQALWDIFGPQRLALDQTPPGLLHQLLARFEAGLRADQQFLLVTGFMAGAHQRAGSQRVAELHGNLRSTRCSRRACHLPPFGDDRPYATGAPPCPACGAPLRPDVVLGGEPVVVDAQWQAMRALRECDLFIAVHDDGDAAEFIGATDAPAPGMAAALRAGRAASGAAAACADGIAQAEPLATCLRTALAAGARTLCVTTAQLAELLGLD